MLDDVWPTLPAQLRDELITQCVRTLKGDPAAYDQFAHLVASITNSRMDTVKSQWRIGNFYGTKLALSRDPGKASPALAQAFLAARKGEVTALYNALGVEHKDLEVDDASVSRDPPTEVKFAAVLQKGLEGISPDILKCMIAVIADSGIDQWQLPARNALVAHLAPRAG